ncbi:MAG: T9SS type A sorting domain-containing protein [Bacteroidia bacterium]|nr:T9SS type A sorting domain-containing protein [Bacteroidia bacterium]
MKQIILLSAIMIITCSMNAQTWAPAGATWYFSYSTMMSYGYIKIEYKKDSVIQNKNCKLLQKTAYGCTYPGYLDTALIGNEYTYFDSVRNVVYRYFNNQFDTLYNFNAQVGDMWQVGRQVFADSGTVVVDSTGYEIINSDTLKSIYVSKLSGSCVGWYSAKIVERIGCINEFIFPDYNFCISDVDEGGPFRCYHDNNFNLYSSGIESTCDHIAGINTPYESFIIYPVPVSSSLVIEICNPKEYYPKIELLNMQGQEVFEGNMNVVKRFIIDMSMLQSGMYIFKIINNYGIVMTKKIIKE